MKQQTFDNDSRQHYTYHQIIRSISEFLDGR